VFSSTFKVREVLSHPYSSRAGGLIFGSMLVFLQIPRELESFIPLGILSSRGGGIREALSAGGMAGLA